MSAAQHREEAKRHVVAAETHERQYNPGVTAPLPPDDATGAGYNFTASSYNPTEWHLAEANRLREHAGQHRKAAQALERFEANECKAFPPTTRAACPLLGPVTSIDDIGGGVRVSFAPGTRVDAVVAHMRCHFAYAQAQGFAEAAACPLYVRGIDIRRGSDALSVEIVSKDPGTTAEIRARSREEAVYLHERRP
jgi:hypothetical protein